MCWVVSGAEGDDEPTGDIGIYGCDNNYIHIIANSYAKLMIITHNRLVTLVQNKLLMGNSSTTLIIWPRDYIDVVHILHKQIHTQIQIFVHRHTYVKFEMYSICVYIHVCMKRRICTYVRPSALQLEWALF